MKLRLRRRSWFLLLALLCAGGVGGWAWAVVTPSIGEPWVAARNNEASSDAPQTRLWRFGFVGDTHAGLGNSTVDEIFQRFEDAGVEFVLHLGDMVDVGASDTQWDQLARLAHSHHVRLMPVVGNHDVHRGYPQDRGEIRWRQYFPQLPETFYSFSHRGLNFVMLNSERVLVPGSEQATFLARQLRAETATTFVCLHRPVFTCGKRDLPFVMARRLWLHRLLRETNATCVLTGHNHYYERTRPLDGITYLVSGGGAPNQYEAETPNARTAEFVSGKAHYGLVEVYHDSLSVRVIDFEGSALDQFELPIRTAQASTKKARDDRWGRELPPHASIGANETSQQAARALPRLW